MSQLPRLEDAYIVEAEIGRGAFGAVHRGRDRATGAPVAIKIGLGATEEDTRERTEREARLLLRISHPRVAAFLGCFDAGKGSLALVFEYIDGLPLRDVMEPPGSDPAAGLAWCRDVADGLDAIHAAGLVHRDLKPENVMIDRAGRAKLIDFGLTRTEVTGATVTREGTLLGTPAYMAPEQLRGERVSARSDLYALACMVYEALTGDPPFLGTPLEMAHAHMLRPSPAPTSRNPRLPAALDAWAARALAKDPSERPPDGAALVAELSSALGRPLRDDRTKTLYLDRSTATRAPSAPGLGPGPEPPGRLRPRVPLPAIASTLLAVLLAVAGWVRSRPPPEPVPSVPEVPGPSEPMDPGSAIWTLRSDELGLWFPPPAEPPDRVRFVRHVAQADGSQARDEFTPVEASDGDGRWFRVPRAARTSEDDRLAPDLSALLEDGDGHLREGGPRLCGTLTTAASRQFDDDGSPTRPRSGPLRLDRSGDIFLADQRGNLIRMATAPPARIGVVEDSRELVKGASGVLGLVGITAGTAAAIVVHHGKGLNRVALHAMDRTAGGVGARLGEAVEPIPTPEGSHFFLGWPPLPVPGESTWVLPLGGVGAAALVAGSGRPVPVVVPVRPGPEEWFPVPYPPVRVAGGLLVGHLAARSERVRISGVDPASGAPAWSFELDPYPQSPPVAWRDGLALVHEGRLVFLPAAALRSPDPLAHPLSRIEPAVTDRSRHPDSEYPTAWPVPFGDGLDVLYLPRRERLSERHLRGASLPPEPLLWIRRDPSGEGYRDPVVIDFGTGTDITNRYSGLRPPLLLEGGRLMILALYTDANQTEFLALDMANQRVIAATRLPLVPTGPRTTPEPPRVVLGPWAEPRLHRGVPSGWRILAVDQRGGLHAWDLPVSATVPGTPEGVRFSQ